MNENKIIAKFMGDFMGLLWSDINEFYLDNNGQMAMPINPCGRFHSSWDWLMPVVEKIESTRILDYNIRVTIDSTRTIISITHSGKGSIKTFYKGIYEDSDDKITRTYKVIIEFIKWYNQNKL